jgi:hypothetical protein
MTRNPAADLVERLCRPQRIGLFGHRGVGKTTLLTMLYREATGGRLPGLRLAAADAATASHLADKIVQLEAGETLPATLAETELRFHLYHEGARIELVVLDYQGEHVALGRQEPVRDFLRDCDAVLLCLDAPVTGQTGPRWQAEQEVEQVVEDYLATERAGEPHRPMALAVTKADLIDAGDAEAVRQLLAQQLGMTQHTLTTHCPWHDVFVVSSLGTPGQGLAPSGLDAPLAWLARALYEQDLARLEQLWQLAPGHLKFLGQATRAFARRYPDAPATRAFRARLATARRQRLARWAVGVVATLLTVSTALWSYDAWGEWRARAQAGEHADNPAAAREVWGGYQLWHPTRSLTRPESSLEHEKEQVQELDRVLREQDRSNRLTELRRQARDPDADPETVWAEFLRFRDRFPEYDLDAEGALLRQRIKAASDRQREQREQAERIERERQGLLAVRQLVLAERKGDLVELVGLAGKLAREHARTTAEAELLRRQKVYLARLDERDFEAARDYSRRNPGNYFTRRQRYQQYLDRHPSGASAAQARKALSAIVGDWDRHDYRLIRERYLDKPGELKDLKARSRAYLSAHPEGRYRASVSALLRWCNRVSEEGDYRVTLKSGSFSKKAAAWLSRGARLSVEIEVGGVRYGPSTIVHRSYEPEWDYEFNRKVRWKAGDAVRIIVTDNYFWKRKVADETFDGVLAMRNLSGEVEVRHGSLTFASDFTMPTLPRAD